MLVVEDEYLSRQLLSLIIRKYGSIDSADDGEEALRLVRTSLEERRPYDLIFMDIVLPTMDGLAALKGIRALEAAQGATAMEASKIIMVSALSDSETLKDSRDGQCEAYITKPYLKALLESTIERLFQ